MTKTSPQTISRRRLLKTSALSASALVFAPTILRAQGARVRKNMLSKGGQIDLETYREGVIEMLKLPLTDGRNWYRQGFVHFIDCPHGNWWFTSWHRGYLGYFEEIIRELTGKEEFMLPYWDWTTKPHEVPASMFGTDNPMDPVNFKSDTANYIATRQDFQDQVRPVMEDFWNNMSAGQVAQQRLRENMDFETMWSTKEQDNATFAFQETKFARFITKANPQLDAPAQSLVKLSNLLANLTPTKFAGKFENDDPFFENSVTETHQFSHPTRNSFSGLSATHNLVHNSVGGTSDGKGSYKEPWGIMTNNLSPLDPIFFLHHSNIDRLWDVWTRKQQALGLPIAPEGELLERYKKEEYLFFYDRFGNPVSGTPKSWDYFETSAFDYTYEPGSGEQIVPPNVAMASSKQVAQGRALTSQTGSSNVANLIVPSALAASVTQPKNSNVHLAVVRFTPPAHSRGKVFNLYISPEGQSAKLGQDSPELAGSFAFFGHSHITETKFTVSIDEALDRLTQAGLVKEGAALSFTLAIAGSDETVAANVKTTGALQSVNVHVLSNP